MVVWHQGRLPNWPLVIRYLQHWLAMRSYTCGHRSNTSTIALRTIRDENRTKSLGYNWTGLFLEDVNTRTWPSRLGSLESERVNYGHESCGTRTQEWLQWWGPAVNCKLQTHSLVRDGTQHQQIHKIWLWAWHQERLADWPSVEL
jgi:hypothetical protein